MFKLAHFPSTVTGDLDFLIMIYQLQRAIVANDFPSHLTFRLFIQPLVDARNNTEIFGEKQLLFPSLQRILLKPTAK